MFPARNKGQREKEREREREREKEKVGTLSERRIFGFQLFDWLSVSDTTFSHPINGSFSLDEIKNSNKQTNKNALTKLNKKA